MKTIREAKHKENEARSESKKARMVDPQIDDFNGRRKLGKRYYGNRNGKGIVMMCNLDDGLTKMD